MVGISRVSDQNQAVIFKVTNKLSVSKGMAV